MESNVSKVVHYWAFRRGERPGAEPGAPEFVDLMDRIFEKGLVLDAADRVLLLTGSKARIRLEKGAV